MVAVIVNTPLPLLTRKENNTPRVFVNEGNVRNAGHRVHHFDLRNGGVHGTFCGGALEIPFGFPM